MVILKNNQNNKDRKWFGDDFKNLKFNNVKLKTNDVELLLKSVRDGIVIANKNTMVPLLTEYKSEKLNLYIYKPSSNSTPLCINILYQKLIDKISDL